MTSVPSTRPSEVLRRARAAVGICFFVNAVLYANVVPRLPEIKADLGLSNAALGAALAALPLGALLAALSSAALMRRFGSARVASTGLVLSALTVWTVSIAPDWATLAAAMLVAGALDAIIDVAQNAHGLRVQRGYRRSILNAFHGIWSIGAVSGGLIGSAAAGLGIPLTLHLGGAAVVFGALAVVAYRAMLPGADDGDREARPRLRPALRSQRAAARGAPRHRRSPRSGSWPPAAPSWRTPGRRGARCTCAPRSAPGRRPPGWVSSPSRPR